MENIPDLEGVADKVIINKNQGWFVGPSKVSDYVYRPSMYEHVSLYDWIHLHYKSTKRQTRKKKVGDAIDDPDFVEESGDELNIQPGVDVVEEECDTKYKADSAPLNDFIDDDILYKDYGKDNDDDDDDELDVMDELAEDIPKKNHSFQPGHSQYATHCAHVRKENPLVVPNFMPVTLPRSDRGDHEYYCCAMLTFFKP
jgi:hypothetical protein